jgi:GNAT superfamily N-acetyltransferase
MLTQEEPAAVVDGEVDRVAGMWARAFAGDSMATWPMPAGVDETVMAGVFKALVPEYIALRAAWQVGDCTAAAAWLPPSGAASYAAMEGRTRAAILPLTDDGGSRYVQFWDWLSEQVPDEPAWFLDVVGVDPSAQGRGLGRRLIEHGLTLAQRDGLPAFLETGNRHNVAYYETFGFGVHRVADAPGGGPRIWFMSLRP